MRRVIFSILVALAFAAGPSAQARPNFAGQWKAAGSFTTWAIAIEGSRMTITQTVAGNTDSTVYMLDGTPSKKQFEGPNGPAENIYTCTWEGEVLVTTIQTAFGTTLTEKRWLEPDGTMRVQNILTIPGKPSPPPGPGMVLTKIK